MRTSFMDHTNDHPPSHPETGDPAPTPEPTRRHDRSVQPPISQIAPTSRPGWWQILPGAELPSDTPVAISESVYAAIASTVGSLPAETGGMLGGSRISGIIDSFEFDTTSVNSAATYTPDISVLNQILAERWNPEDTQLVGMIHSHPSGCERPSLGDERYAERILAAIPDMGRLVLPIVQPGESGSMRLRTFVATRHRERRARIPNVAITEVPMVIHPSPGHPDDDTFQRVTGAYDLERMANSRLVVVGAGGAAAFVEDMARAGVGQFVLIDPDTVSVTNLATQQVYRRDLGRPKVDPIADRILDINPHATVVTHHGTLDDLDDEMIDRLLHRKAALTEAPPAATILCGFTDRFDVQDLVVRLALVHGVPMLAAQVWPEGTAAEVSFTAPGITPACGRCVLGSRYRARRHTHHSDAASDGTPLTTTTRLNALKAQVALALLHGCGDTIDTPPAQRWKRILDLIAERNLALVRLHPDLETITGVATFDLTDDADLVVDDTRWRHQAPEHPDTGFDPCPYCRGSGDLTALVGGPLPEADLSPAPDTDRITSDDEIREEVIT